jgi:hypothetical protein
MARLLMIVSSVRSIDLVSENGHETGYSADEVLKPYDKFVAAGVEVVAATPDGKAPQADPFTLEPQFHYPDEDKDFLSQVVRSFAPDLDDIRVTLHHLSELDLIAARRVSQTLTVSGLDHDSAWSLVSGAARTAWREDRNFIEILAEDPEVTGKLSPEHLRALALEVQDESVVRQERRDLATEELHDGLRHDVQGQGVACVHLHQARPVMRKTGHFFLCQ